VRVPSLTDFYLLNSTRVFEHSVAFVSDPSSKINFSDDTVNPIVGDAESIWTGTLGDGKRGSSFQCGDWSVQTGSTEVGAVGLNPNPAITGEWTYSGSANCNTYHHLLCIQN